MAGTVDAELSYQRAEWLDFAHTGPGTLAGRYMRMFWQPVYPADDLPTGRAVPIQIMSEDFTLYRGDGGAPHLLAFRCAHRGTQLSTGWVEGDDLRCFYHGWKYDGSGQCIEQPAEPEPFCPKIRISSYPVYEYLGLIFAYLGDDEPRPVPRFEKLEEEGFIESDVRLTPCNYFNAVENDAIHNAFAHSRGLPSPIATISAVETDWGIAESARDPGGEVKVKQWGVPNKVHLKEPVGNGQGFKDVIYWHVPVDDERHLAFSQGLVPLVGEARRRYEERRASEPGKKFAPELIEAIVRGETRIQDLYKRTDIAFNSVEHGICHVGQGPIADRDQENLGATDASIILHRKILARELQALADGEPITEWVHSDRIVPTVGAMSGYSKVVSEKSEARFHWERKT